MWTEIALDGSVERFFLLLIEKPFNKKRINALVFYSFVFAPVSAVCRILQ